MDPRRDNSRLEHGVIDGTAVNVALPALQQSLGATVIDVQWSSNRTRFCFPHAAHGGLLGDYYGRPPHFPLPASQFSLSLSVVRFRD